MGTMTKLSATVLVAVACVYFIARTPGIESPPMSVALPQAGDVEFVGAADVIAAADLEAEPARGGASLCFTYPLRSDSPKFLSMRLPMGMACRTATIQTMLIRPAHLAS
jgi:hypothetical protein